MAVQPETTQYTFQFLDERRIHAYFDKAGTAGLREMAEAVLSDVDALERLADGIDGGDSYSIAPDRVHAWWGWG